MTLENFHPEKPKPKIYLPEVRAIINSIKYLRDKEKELTGKGDKKDTLHHSQRVANLGYLLAKHQKFSDEETNFFVETCLLHDIGKMQVPVKYLTRASGKFGSKDRKVLTHHPDWGYSILKDEGRSPRVYNPVYYHHEYQEQSYPDTKAKVLKRMENTEDIDFDNARLLAMADVFDRRIFGSSNIPPQLPEQAEEKLKEQFDQPGDAEIIAFLFLQCEEIKNLNI
ncbi:MAG: HD domain-containing protein [Candidatus Moranbacteria bacterium]|nr:HD domain-containing protein [Candidatus Moranbacteria bacterium]